MPVCVNIHVVAFPKIKKGRSGEILNIYLHVVNNQKLHTVPLVHKIWERKVSLVPKLRWSRNGTIQSCIASFPGLVVSCD